MANNLSGKPSGVSTPQAPGQAKSAPSAPGVLGRVLLLIGNEGYTSSVEQNLKRLGFGAVELEVVRAKSAGSIAARIARGVYDRVLISAFNKHRLLLSIENAARKAQVELRFCGRCGRCGTRELVQALAA